MSDFVMPSLGADMERGTLVEWLVKPGQAVKRGDIVAVVETHKGAIDVEIFEDGVVAELCVPEGKEVPVGTVLAHVTSAGGAPAAKASAPPPPPAPSKPAPAARAPTAPPPAPPPAPTITPAAPITGAHVKVTPAARRRAAELGLDIARIAGTGVDGSVTLADVALAATVPSAKTAPAAPPARTKRAGFDPAEMRRAIAAAMSRSKREIPHYYLSETTELSRALAWLEAFNRDRAPDARLLPAALLLKAAALALREVPRLNGFWEGDAFRPGPGIHVGWAIALRGGGLVAPAIHDADRLPLPDLMDGLRDLVQRARAGGLRGSELTDPTVTVTSLGERGAETVMGIIYPPQVAIVGFGRIVTRPWVVDGRVEPRPVVSLSLAADHRASDGHLGGQLLAAIDRLLQEPETL
ncbi:MAG: dihydrolipoamide acetyltransferase family protein [Candidatus Eiseniibacteriota bacterium]